MHHQNKALSLGTRFEDKVVSLERAAQIAENIRGLGMKVVLTSGTFDLKHVGHDRYLEKARSLGDFLIVGVDSDAKVRARKGPSRPIVGEEERMEGLAHLLHVDAIVLKGADDKPHALIEAVRPDILVISETTDHAKGYVEEVKEFCGTVENLPPQAETSTTARIRLLHVEGIDSFAKQAHQAIDKLVAEMKGSE